MSQRSIAKKHQAVHEFTNDVYEITERLSKKLNSENLPKLNLVRHQLIEMYKENLVKINHSVLELICASELISKGFSVDVEKAISDILVCDVYARNDQDCSIIEIETGFTPPEHALDTVDYYTSRIISKIARYSKFCDKFSLATPVIGILPIPKLFCKPVESRTDAEIQKLKDLCDRYYKNPPIEFDDIKNAKLNSVYLIHIDKNFAKEISPTQYSSLVRDLSAISNTVY